MKLNKTLFRTPENNNCGYVLESVCMYYNTEYTSNKQNSSHFFQKKRANKVEAFSSHMMEKNQKYKNLPKN